MMWKVKFDGTLEKPLKKMDVMVRTRIFDFLRNRVALLENPRVLAEPMKGSNFVGLYRYRVGDYRLICRIEDETVTILVVRIGHRKNVYQN